MNSYGDGQTSVVDGLGGEWNECLEELLQVGLRLLEKELEDIIMGQIRGL